MYNIVRYELVLGKMEKQVLSTEFGTMDGLMEQTIKLADNEFWGHRNKFHSHSWETVPEGFRASLHDEFGRATVYYEVAEINHKLTENDLVF